MEDSADVIQSEEAVEAYSFRDSEKTDTRRNSERKTPVKYRSIEVRISNFPESDGGENVKVETLQGKENKAKYGKQNRKSRVRKSEPIDPLMKKYLELNEILKKDYIERKKAEQQLTLHDVDVLCSKTASSLRSQHTPVVCSQRGVVSAAASRLLQGADPVIRVPTVMQYIKDGDSVSDEDSRENLGRNLPTLGNEQYHGKKTAVLKGDHDNRSCEPRRKRPASATSDRRSGTTAQRHSSRGGQQRRSRSAGNGPVTGGRLANSSFQSDSLSCSKTGRDTSMASSPRRVIEPIDCQLKSTNNEDVLKWLKEKNKLLKQEIKTRKAKKRQLLLEQMDKVTSMFERSLQSQRETMEWLRRKRKEAWVKRKEKKLMVDIQNKEASREKGTPRNKTLRVTFADNVDVVTEYFSDAQVAQDGDVHSKRRSKVTEETVTSLRSNSPGKHPLKTSSKDEKRKSEHNPPFIYKRPFVRKIRFTTRCGSRSDSRNRFVEKREQSEDEKKEQARISYNQWLLRKRKEQMEKRKIEGKGKNLADSDPVVEVLSNAGKRRVKEVLEKKKSVDTGLSASCTISHTTTKSSSEQSHASNMRSKQSRPPERVRRQLKNIMESNCEKNPFVLPFPPELGVPRHVASKQREIFAERLWKAEDKTHGETERMTTTNHNKINAVIPDSGRQETRSTPRSADNDGQVNHKTKDTCSPSYRFHERNLSVSSSSSGGGVQTNTEDTESSCGTNKDKTLNKEESNDNPEKDNIFLTSLEID